MSLVAVNVLFSLQPLDETPATLVPVDCPRPWPPRIRRVNAVSSPRALAYRIRYGAEPPQQPFRPVAFEVCCSCSGLKVALKSQFSSRLPHAGNLGTSGPIFDAQEGLVLDRLTLADLTQPRPRMYAYLEGGRLGRATVFLGDTCLTSLIS